MHLLDAAHSACGLTGLRAGEQRIVLVRSRSEAWPVGLCGGALGATPARLARLEVLLGPPRAPQGPGLARQADGSAGPAAAAAGGTALVLVVLVGLGTVVRHRRRRRTG